MFRIYHFDQLVELPKGERNEFNDEQSAQQRINNLLSDTFACVKRFWPQNENAVRIGWEIREA